MSIVSVRDLVEKTVYEIVGDSSRLILFKRVRKKKEEKKVSFLCQDNDIRAAFSVELILI